MGWPVGQPLLAEVAKPFLLAGCTVALAPLSWLWTGNLRTHTSLTRGLFQSIPWNALWLLALATFASWVLPDAPKGSRPRPQPQVVGKFVDFPPHWSFFLFHSPLTVVLGWFMAEKERARAAAHELKALADRARAQALQAQLNPHVLFNALGGITEMVHEDPDATEAALIGLVELYRDLTRHSAALHVPLRNEREILERYLDLEAIRLEDRLEVEWDWPSWADSLELPPFLLQPLVENAIKHGISPSPEGGRVKVQVSRSTSSLSLQVANTGCPLAADPPEGTGLGNLRARLALMPAFAPRLTLNQEGEEVVARLTLSWRWTS